MCQVFMFPVIALNQGAQAGAFKKSNKPRSVQKITHALFCRNFSRRRV